jgi:hypothetical protein
MTNSKLKKKYNTAKSFPACHGAMRDSCFDTDTPLFGDEVYAAVRLGLKNSFTPTTDDESGANADAAPSDEVERRGASRASNEGTLSQTSTPSLAHRRRDGLSAAFRELRYGSARIT